MFEVYGGESESMSDQYRILYFFQPFIKHIAFRRMTASMLAFLLFEGGAYFGGECIQTDGENPSGKQRKIKNGKITKQDCFAS